MSISLESKKLKRTGFDSAFLGGGVLAGLVPIIDMAFRSENYMGLNKPPLEILLNANWQMMSMLNVLLIVIGSCIMYHTEYADNAMQKMQTLPIKESTVFFSKFILLVGTCFIVFIIEAAAIAFSTLHWFSTYSDFWLELLKNFGYMLLLTIPSAAFSLVIASLCKNMWISLGIGVVCVFTATILPATNFTLSLFPFALPFQTLARAGTNEVLRFSYAACIEIVIASIAELIILKVRRSFE